MKLLADSGSTKTDWVLSANGKRVQKITTRGINPFYQNSQNIRTILERELLPKINSEAIKTLHFYGAGCSFPDKKQILSEAFRTCFSEKLHLELNSDLVAAARATCGNSEGIACILGTGSNSCQWDGQQIVENVPPLGFILGDEGSGATMGKLLVADVLKNQLSEVLTQKFFKSYNTNYQEIMNAIYKQEFPNRYLAQFTYFLKEHLEAPEISAIVNSSLDSFFRRNIAQYTKLPIHFVGSISVVFEENIRKIAHNYGLTVGRIIKAPIEQLIDFHR